MRTLMVAAFISLDGVVQAPGGPDEDRDGGFEHGGWAVPHIDDEVLARAIGSTARADALLLGRRTYEEFAATWPLASADDPIGSKWNAVPKYVASRTLTSVSWQNSTLLDGEAADAVAELKKSDGGEIQVHGSGQLVQTLLTHDLVDELHLVVIPVLIGSGKRLFGSGTVPARFDLVASATTRSGVVVGRYARAGAITYGALGPETGNW
ncbi:dihydrofolate reductase family protein [Pseudonocardia cypriaca]|uniref:Dihydrofolate reductase n=1 Tax=Pseudonocardia cypriaca TaxID=882449 RepID=A0A543GHF6_9PSEU|nr:dihydrofolate reductase family protein [Pseudonocardia cypriaca]TQM45493.1 dihydrofolate reductase [Pseudonocardia cypriaca]